MKKTLAFVVLTSLTSFATQARAGIFCRSTLGGPGGKEIVIVEETLKPNELGFAGYDKNLSTKGHYPDEEYYAVVTFGPIINTRPTDGAKLFINLIVGVKYYRQDNDQPYSQEDFDHMGSAVGGWGDLKHMMLRYDLVLNPGPKALVGDIQMVCRSN